MHKENIVLHDYFETTEGGGRLCLILAQGINADLAYGFKVEGHPYFDAYKLSGKQYDLISFTKLPIYRQFRLARAFAQKTGFLCDYKTAIYSGFYTPLAVDNHPKGKNIFYCHTPPRFIYDQKDFYLAQIPFWQRPLLHWFINYLQPKYEQAVRKMDVVVANSKNVQRRIKKYLDLDSVVIYPPCETEKFKWLGQGDYYLSMARLDPLKRVDMIVEAFQQMPDKKLIVVSEGPDFAKIQKMAHGYGNIQILGKVNEDKLLELVGNCIATIYIPKDEDFGMCPVESMAAGKPVIGVAEGGLLETLIEGETGILIDSKIDAEKIKDSFKIISRPTALSMKADCINKANFYKNKNFRMKIENFLKKNKL